MSLAQAMGDFTTGLELGILPEKVLTKARNCLVYGYGIGLGCWNTPYVGVGRQAAIAMFGQMKEGASFLGDGRRTAISGAALANAALFHGRAQEDTCGAAHLGAILVPLVTALAEARRYPIDRLLPALVAGYECGGLLEGAFARFTTPGGHRATAIYGPIAAAAAASRMMGLSAAQTAAALSNAASFAGGVLQSFADGTDEWRYHVGMAGHTGFTAAELAAAGSVSAPDAFEGSSGFIRAFAGGGKSAEGLSEQLGNVWSIERVAYKPFPVCAFNQTPVTAALALREEIAGRPIRNVGIAMTPYEANYAGMASYGPFSTISGTLMSAPFCVATSLLHGAPTMSTMTDYENAAVQALLPNVAMNADEAVASLCTRLIVELEDGTRLDRYERKTPADYAYDRPEISELIRRVGAETGIPSTAYDEIENFVDDLPNVDIDMIVSIFSRSMPR